MQTQNNYIEEKKIIKELKGKQEEERTVFQAATSLVVSLCDQGLKQPLKMWSSLSEVFQIF